MMHAKLPNSLPVVASMAHYSIGFEKAIGMLSFEDKSNFIMRTLVKRIVLKPVNKGDWSKNQQTFSYFAITENKDF